MKVLVACEFSGVVRDAFIARGHDAVSCDLLPTEVDGPHIQGDVLDILDMGWDLLIAHPPCTYLCNSGAHWLHRQEGRWELMRDGAEFFRRFLEAPVPRVCVENPLMHRYAIHIIGQKHSQIVQPYNFGEDASKATCLWLRGLPLLENTSYFPPRIVDGKKRWSNQTNSGQNRLGPSADRWKLRSMTYQGIADAMAEQWG